MHVYCTFVQFICFGLGSLHLFAGRDFLYACCPTIYLWLLQELKRTSWFPQVLPWTWGGKICCRLVTTLSTSEMPSPVGDEKLHCWPVTVLVFSCTLGWHSLLSLLATTLFTEVLSTVGDVLENRKLHSWPVNELAFSCKLGWKERKEKCIFYMYFFWLIDWLICCNSILLVESAGLSLRAREFPSHYAFEPQLLWNKTTQPNTRNNFVPQLLFTFPMYLKNQWQLWKCLGFLTFPPSSFYQKYIIYILLST